MGNGFTYDPAGVFGRGAIAGGSGLDGRRASAFTCAERQYDGVVCLLVEGELDLSTATAFRGQLKKAAERGGDLVVDLHALQYIDSSGINALLEARKNLGAEGRKIVLAAISPTIEQVLRIIAVDQVLPVFPTVEAALESLRRPAGETG